MIGKRRNVVMLDKDDYDSMTEAFYAIKAERKRNKELTDKLKKEIDALGFELIHISSNVSEFMTAINTLRTEIKRIDDPYTVRELCKKVDYTIYMADRMNDKIHKLRDIIDNIRKTTRPWEKHQLL